MNRQKPLGVFTLIPRQCFYSYRTKPEACSTATYLFLTLHLEKTKHYCRHFFLTAAIQYCKKYQSPQLFSKSVNSVNFNYKTLTWKCIPEVLLGNNGSYHLYWMCENLFLSLSIGWWKRHRTKDVKEIIQFKWRYLFFLLFVSWKGYFLEIHILQTKIVYVSVFRVLENNKDYE